MTEENKRLEKLKQLNDALIAAISAFEEQYKTPPDCIYLSGEQKDLIANIYHASGSPETKITKLLTLNIRPLNPVGIASIPPFSCVITRDGDLKPEDQFQECICLDLSPLKEKVGDE